MASFHDLPVELFMAILECLIHTAHPKDHSPILKAVVLVSKHWNSTSQSDTLLWCTLSGADPPAWVERVLRNSAPDSPLNVRFVRFSQQHSMTQWFQDIAVALVDRWAHVRIECRFVPIAVEEAMLASGAPRLQHLSMFADRFTQPVELYRDHISRLRSLSLDGQMVPWQSKMLRATSLQHLFISNTRSPYPSLSVLFDILRSCPNLVRLAIKNVLIQELGDTDTSPIIMARLTHIDLELRLPPMATLLPLLHSPSIFKSIVVVQKGASKPAMLDGLLKFLAPVVGQLVERTPKGSPPRIVLEHFDGWNLRVGFGAFTLGTSYSAVMELGPLLSTLLDFPIAVIYRNRPPGCLFTQLSTIHNILPNITYLRLPPHCPDLCRILSAMAARQTEFGQEILPTIRILVLEQRRLESKESSAAEFLAGLTNLMEARRASAKDTLVIQHRCSDVNDGYRELSEQFPGCFVCGVDDEVEWWDRPEVSIDPDYEKPYFMML